MSHFVYVARCKDDSLYTGYTRDVKSRIWHHNNSRFGAKSIRGKLPVKLVYSEEFDTISDALKREREIKKWRRSKKEQLLALALRSEATKRE